jgi:hypothetical protein
LFPGGAAAKVGGECAISVGGVHAGVAYSIYAFLHINENHTGAHPFLFSRKISEFLIGRSTA